VERLTSFAVELWLVDLETCADALELLERETPRLSLEEQQRADALRDPRDRRSRLTAYCALRLLLERVAGPGVRGRELVRSVDGKPRLDSGGAEFSLSHIDDLALIAVSPAMPLGVDLEKVRPVKMGPRHLAEISAIGKGLGDKPLPALGAERAFLQAWTRLEAFTKARGRGLAQTLANVGARGRGGARRLSPAELQVRARRLAHEEGLTVHDVPLSSTLHGAVALPRGARPPRARAFPIDQAAMLRLLGASV
jgi:phosphopantetheinyl transferase